MNRPASGHAAEGIAGAPGTVGDPDVRAVAQPDRSLGLATSGVHAHRPRRRARPRLDVALIGWLAFGCLVRVALARSALGRPNSDEAVAMLMAKHAAHGQFRTFFWGGNYGGALSAPLEAPFVKLFGTHLAVYRLVNGTLAFLCALLVGYVASRLLGRNVGRLAAAIFWVFPSMWVLQSTQDLEFYVPGLLCALAVAAACLRDQDAQSERWLWLIGLLAGLSFWAFPLLGCIVVPAIAAKAWSLRRSPFAIVTMLALAPLGAAPWLYTTLRTHLATLHSTVAANTGLYERVLRSITVVLPSSFLFGSRLQPSAGTQAVAGVLVVVTVAVVAERAARSGRWQLALAASPLILWPLVLGLSNVYEGPDTARYGLVVMPTVAVLGAWALHRIRADVVVVAAAASLAVFSFGPTTADFRVVPSVDPSITALASHLSGVNRRHVFAGYWTAYVLTVDTDEAVTADPVVDSRYQPYRTAAVAAPSSTYVMQAGNHNDQVMTTWLTGHGGGARVVIGPFAVFELDGRVEPAQLPAFGVEAM